MTEIETLLAHPLPMTLEYSGKSSVRRRLKRLTIVEWADLGIGFLTAAGSKAGKTTSGECMWILDIALNYDLTAQGMETRRAETASQAPGEA